MNFAERINAIFDFEKPDQMPLVDWGYWDEIFDQWPQEGLPVELVHVSSNDSLSDIDLATFWGGLYERKIRTLKILDYFGIEPWLAQTTVPIIDTIFPFFEEEILEDRGEKVIVRDRTGIILQKPKTGTAFPGYLEFPVKTQADYEALRPRLNPDTPGRYIRGWDIYAQMLLDRGKPLTISFQGFFGFPRELMGIENLAMAYYLDPDLVQGIVEDRCSFIKRLFLPILKQFPVECVLIWEDMAYKTGAMISPTTFREFMLPYYQEVTDFFHNMGVRFVLVDSDGNIVDLCSLFIEGGVDGVYPLEITAGSDPLILRKRYPNLILVGGIDKRVLAGSHDCIDMELKKVAAAVEMGGYLPMLDHLVPPDVSLINYQYYLMRMKELI